MSNDTFDVKISFTDITFGTFAQIFGEIAKANPGILTAIETNLGSVNLHSTDSATETGAAGKVVPLEPEKTSKRKSAKSETKSTPKASKGGESKEEAETEDDEEEAPKKATSKSGAKSSSKSTPKKKPEPEPEEDEDEGPDDDELTEPVEKPDVYDMESLKQLIADTNDAGYDVLDEVLEYFDVKSIKKLDEEEIKPFYKKVYKAYKAAAASEEEGE